jgi:hypothetical protein
VAQLVLARALAVVAQQEVALVETRRELTTNGLLDNFPLH